MKVTPLRQESSAAAKVEPWLTRRSMLKGSGILMGSIAAGSLLATLAPSTSWAVELKVFNQSEGEALLAMTRTLFPHEHLPDAVYAIAVKDLDAAAAGNAATLNLLRTGLADLNGSADGAFAKADAPRRLALVTAIAGTPFFNAVRGKCVTSLYDNEMAFATFGYPGSAWEHGGYIKRGFQDLKWLPDPPPAASPAPYVASS